MAAHKAAKPRNETGSVTRWCMEHLLVCLAAACSAVWFFPELIYQHLDLNDEAFHLSLISGAIREFERGGNPLDFWVPIWGGGMAMFANYQHLPHILITVLHFASLKYLSVPSIFHFSTWLLLSLWPVSLYVGVRWLGGGRRLASLAAFTGPAVGGLGSYGLVADSYLYAGWGMWSQLWGQIFLPLALGACARYLRMGRKLAVAVLLTSATLLSHLLFGYIVLLSAGLFVIETGLNRSFRKRLVRLLTLGASVLITTSYFVVPMLQGAAYRAISKWDPMEKFDGYGLAECLIRLFNGVIFDWSKESYTFPLLTGLLLLGLVAQMFRPVRTGVFLLGGFGLWFVLWSGRATFGTALDALPFFKDLHYERLVTAVHFFGILLIASGLLRLERFLTGRTFWKPHLLALLLLAFPYYAGHQYAARNHALLKEAAGAEPADRALFEQAIRRIPGPQAGRVWSGPAAGWGNTFLVGQTQVFHALSQYYLPQIGFMAMTWPLLTDFQGLTPYYQERSAWFNLLNIRYFLQPSSYPPPAGTQLVSANDRYALYEFEQHGWFDLVEAKTLLKATRTTFWKAVALWVQSDALERKDFMVIDFENDQDPAGFSRTFHMQDEHRYFLDGDKGVRDIIETPPDFSSSTTEISAQISDERVEDDVYYASATLNSGAYLLFKQSYSPAWKVEVDGQLRPTVMLSPAMVGVKLEPGEHRIKAYYKSSSLKLILLLIGMAYLAFLFYLPFKRPRHG